MSRSRHTLDKGRGGFPQVDYSRGACLFCGECVQVCTPQAIEPLNLVNQFLFKGIAHLLPDMHEVDPAAVVGG